MDISNVAYCLAYKLDYIVMQMRKVNCEKGYYMKQNLQTLSLYLVAGYHSNSSRYHRPPSSSQLIRLRKRTRLISNLTLTAMTCFRINRRDTRATETI